MKSGIFKSDFILLFAATIWGLAFVAQRVGMEHVGPFTFNGLRFLLGCLSLLPVIICNRHSTVSQNRPGLIKSGIIAGICLFFAISLQQVGIVYTTAGKAGFITGLYVVIVPFLTLFLKNEKTTAATWIGAALACTGMYLLSVTRNMETNFGDFLVLLSAFCFAFHLIIIGKLSNQYNAVQLSLVQCLVCAVLSLMVAAVSESFIFKDIIKAAIPLFYGGVMSVGVAYSLQIYGQKDSPSSHAAIIFSLESVVAAIGGWIILKEILTGRALSGCILMMAGILISQLYKKP